MPAIQILVIGRQGSGKSTSWKNMDPKETLIITPNAKPMPWIGSAKDYIPGKNRIQTDQLHEVPGILRHVNKEKTHIKNILVEDITHFMSARTLSPEFMARKVGNEAFARWSEFAADVAAVIKAGDGADFRNDLNIVYHGHTEIDDRGKVILQTSGKLLNRDFKIDSYFTYVLHAIAFTDQEGKVQKKFLTNEDGVHEAKTPIGYFDDLLIDNDIKYVIDTIRHKLG